MEERSVVLTDELKNGAGMDKGMSGRLGVEIS